MPEARAGVGNANLVFPERDADGPDCLSLSRITVSNFRNYHSVRLCVGTDPVILTGANGSGKTNLLEAISLLVPGRGLRRCALADLQNNSTTEPWAVAAELRTMAGGLRIGTGRDNAANDCEGERRVVYIDGKPSRSQSLLAEHITMACITPDMDRLLSEGSAARRKFLDRLAYSFDPAHGTRVLAYEKAMRERLSLLREGRADASWLSALENEMAQKAVSIAATRRHMVDRLRLAIDGGGDAFTKADIAAKGFAEDMLDHKPALLVEDALRAAFSGARAEDALRGTCSIGVHRSDLIVFHRDKRCPADLCSTGEQKALMIGLMLAYVRLLVDQRHMRPLFLLDDIAAHLDDSRRRALFDEVFSIGCQAWFSGTEIDIFKAISSEAQMVRVENGALLRP